MEVTINIISTDILDMRFNPCSMTDRTTTILIVWNEQLKITKSIFSTPEYNFIITYEIYGPNC